MLSWKSCFSGLPSMGEKTLLSGGNRIDWFFLGLCCWPLPQQFLWLHQTMDWEVLQPLWWDFWNTISSEQGIKTTWLNILPNCIFGRVHTTQFNNAVVTHARESHSQLHGRSCQINCLWKKICTRQCRISGNFNLPGMSSHSLLSPWLNKHNSSQTMLANEKRQTLLTLIEFVARKAAKNNPSESRRQNWQKGSDPGSWVCLHSSKFHVLHIPAGDGLRLFILPYICAKWFGACTDSGNIFAFVLSPSPSSPEQGNYYLAHRTWRICAL